MTGCLLRGTHAGPTVCDRAPLLVLSFKRVVSINQNFWLLPLVNMYHSQASRSNISHLPVVPVGLSVVPKAFFAYSSWKNRGDIPQGVRIPGDSNLLTLHGVSGGQPALIVCSPVVRLERALLIVNSFHRSDHKSGQVNTTIKKDKNRATTQFHGNGSLAGNP